MKQISVLRILAAWRSRFVNPVKTRQNDVIERDCKNATIIGLLATTRIRIPNSTKSRKEQQSPRIDIPGSAVLEMVKWVTYVSLQIDIETRWNGRISIYRISQNRQLAFWHFAIGLRSGHWRQIEYQLELKNGRKLLYWAIIRKPLEP